jgi:hypothetical protein
MVSAKAERREGGSEGGRERERRTNSARTNRKEPCTARVAVVINQA